MGGAYHQKPSVPQIGCGLLFEVFNNFFIGKVTSENVINVGERRAVKSGWGLQSKTLHRANREWFIV